MSMECPSLDIPITAYAGTFGNPWGPLRCYTASDSTGSTDGQHLKSKKPHSFLLSGILHTDLLKQGFQVIIKNGRPYYFPNPSVYFLRLSLGVIDIQELFMVYRAASACVLSLNCGTQSVTAICLSSHISLSFRLSEIKILIRIISQGEEVNRVIGIGVLFEFKLNIQFVSV